MRKILGISASKRVWGNCETSVRQVLDAASNEGAHTAFLRLPDLDVGLCRGCFTCVGEKGRCPIDDDLYGFLDQVEAADAVLLASPVYFMSASAALVALMDRLLTVSAYLDREKAAREAVTITIMGNNEWRGVAEPFVNLTASLLGCEVTGSLRLVAEGPGEVLGMPGVGEALNRVGRALAGGKPVEKRVPARVCPVCRSDFFRFEPPFIVCPVCGTKGDLETYITGGEFRPTDDAPRWGRAWLDAHLDSWIRPSVRRYAGNRRAILRRLRGLKKRSRESEERGNQDVQ